MKPWDGVKKIDYISPHKVDFVRPRGYFKTLKPQPVEQSDALPKPQYMSTLDPTSQSMVFGLELQLKMKLKQKVEGLCTVTMVPTQLEVSLTNMKSPAWETLMHDVVTREHLGALTVKDDSIKNVRLQSQQYFLWDKDNKLWRVNRDVTKYVSNHYPLEHWTLKRNGIWVVDWKKMGKYNNRILNEDGHLECIEYDSVYCRSAGIKLSTPVHRHTLALCEYMKCHILPHHNNNNNKQTNQTHSPTKTTRKRKVDALAIPDSSTTTTTVQLHQEEVKEWTRIQTQKMFGGSSFSSLAPILETWTKIVGEAKVCGIQLAQNHPETFQSLIQTLSRCQNLCDVMALVGPEAIHLFIMGMTLSTPQTILESPLIRLDWDPPGEEGEEEGSYKRTKT